MPVVFGSAAVLNGESGAAVQAGEAHGAPFLFPDGPPFAHLYGADGTISRAKPAADARFLGMQVFGLAHVPVKRLPEKRRGKGKGALSMVSLPPR